jgi:hypothetical protein
MAAETNRRQAALLGLLLVVLAGLVWWNFTGDATSPAAPPGRPAPQATSAAPAAQPVDDVRLEQLDGAPPEPAANGRNPFRFGARRPTGAPPAFEPGQAGVVEPPLVIPPGAGGTPVMPGGAGPIPLKFIGVVTEPSPGRKLAVLTDGRNTPFYGREGDIIEGRYRIVRIGVESIELAHVDGRGQQTIRLSGS